MIHNGLLYTHLPNFIFIPVKMSMIQWMSNEQSPSLTEFRKYELKKVYVSNIPYNFKWKDLKVLFEKEGKYLIAVEIRQMAIIQIEIENE